MHFPTGPNKNASKTGRQKRALVSRVRRFVCLCVHVFIYYVIIWVNYNDLTATSLESWLVREIIPNGLNSG